MAKNYTENPDANQNIKGRYYAGKSTADGLTNSVKHFRQAIEIDPLRTRIADLQMLTGSQAIFSLLKDVMPEAKSAALKAIEIDDTLAEAHAGLGIFKTAYDWDWSAGKRAKEGS